MADGSVSVEITVEEEKALKALTNVIKKFDELGNEASKDVNKVDQAFSSFAGNLAANAVGKAIGSISSAFGEMVDFIGESIIAASDSENAFNQLAFAMAQTGIYSEQAAQEFKDLADQIQATTAFEDDAVISTAALIQTMARLDKEGLKQATLAATDLAAALRIDLESAGKLVAKAAEGNVTALKKMGFEFQAGSNDAETFANVLLGLEKRIGGSAQAQAKTFAGAIAQLANTYDSLQESVGNIIIQNPAVIAGFQTIRAAISGIAISVAKTFQGGSSDAIKDFFDSILFGINFVVIGTDLLVRTFSFVGNAISASIDVVKIAFTSLTKIIYDVLSSVPFIGDAFEGAAERANKALSGMLTSFDNSVKGMNEAINGETALAKVSDNISLARVNLDLFYKDAKSKGAEIKNNLNPDAGPVDEELLNKKRALNNQILDLDNQLLLAQNQLAFDNDLAEKERILTRNEADIEQIASFELTKSELLYNSAVNTNALLKTEEERALANQKALKEKELRDLAINNKAKQDIRKTDIANQNAFFEAAISLSNSKSKELAAIGKAAALVQLAIKTPEAVGSSFAFGARIGGPPLGFAFGAIAAAAMAQQAAAIAGVKGFANGGIVGGTSTSGDRVSAQVNSGEMILNRQQQTKLFNDINGGGSGGSVIEAISALGDRIAGMTIIVQANSREIARLVRDEKEAGFAI